MTHTTAQRSRSKGHGARNGAAHSPSRRSFLKALGVAGAGAALPVAMSGGAKAASVPQSGEELVTVLDLSKCIGCGACVEACREINAHKFPKAEKPFPPMYPPRVKAEDWSGKQDVDDRLTPYNWLFLQSAQVEHEGQMHELFVPRRCLHCVNPPCANLCPWGAARKEDNGIVRIDDELCLGGAKCRQACPWHIPQRQTGVGLYLRLLPSFAGNGVMYKCDRCHDKVAAAELPACVEVCPQSVQSIGPRSEMEALARKLAEEQNGYIYGLEENGGTNTIYVSPVPFEKINAVLEKGPGKPHMAPVADVMRPETSLAKALVAAPVAGLVAGALKIAATIRKERDNG
ncbi:4Fe-4S dicluster domain-containing protein [Desulfovibrio mangrovi]|uniref:4Fe-4S dicluster domain-containing protein n=1 Tax=Desulfovibrio mangrovi TaxID=2976983 RepID=UPI002245C5D2|nr:4Fe-4S dicluster domain-containing protein [Desulfovibrio mangrovi]UZP67063.1 4Fe-4S dicluster domain-containing protein [Desulfovibrio mangrovi]